jgi:ATP-dependent DNA helicase RecG
VTSVPKAKDPNTPIQYLKGIGPKRAAALAERGIQTVRDLLYYFPFDYLDLSNVEKIGAARRQADSGKWLTIIGRVRTFDLVGRPPRQRFVVVLEDETGTIPLVFFQSIRYFKTAFRPDEMLAVSGKVTGFGGRPQLVHPSIDRVGSAGDDDDEPELRNLIHTAGLVPKYGSSEDLRSVNLHVKGLRRIMRTAVDEYAASVGEFLPADLAERNGFPPLAQALTNIHFPATREDLDASRRRLKFDELFALQLLLALRRASVKVELPGIPYRVESALARRLVDALPFKLTAAQVRVVKEIAGDMKSRKPMNRLLQGDVGSGKTIVALISMLIAIDNGYQAAFMAPTEILAEQHCATLTSLLRDLPVSVRLLVGSQRARLREDVLEDIRRGTVHLIVGTHAIIEEKVEFSRLGLVVIDEQHRFGVSQRAALKEKASAGVEGIRYPDVLVMTATPIPRTLSLTIYGDLDVSIIDALPARRKAVQTQLKTENERKRVYAFLREQVEEGRQVYVVYPLVETSEKLDVKAATEGYEQLRRDVFPDLSVGLVHGKMPSDEKERVMGAFKSGATDILVATTVIEVGIDVPNASVMVIEHADRFGLSQLHQLRGRVGRGPDQSYCVLMAPAWLRRRIRTSAPELLVDGEVVEQLKTQRRLQTMLDTTDGFKIAEIDLELRGPGDFFGTRQSGLPSLQIANLLTDGDLLTLARREAFELIERDPHLRSADHELLRRHVEERMRSALALAEVG